MTKRHGGAAEGPSQRQLRVAEEIRHVLAGVFPAANSVILTWPTRM